MRHDYMIRPREKLGLVRPAFNWRNFARKLVRHHPRRALLPLALVDPAAQQLYVVRRLLLCASYPVSTSRYGLGFTMGSYRTPTGTHRVVSKIGQEAVPLTRFVARKPNGERAQLNPLATISRRDAICTRILHLDGLERGINRGGACDSLHRCIYIHGTTDEKRIGRPSSIGCIRMTNADIVSLFDTLETGSLVHVLNSPRAATGAQ